MNPSWRKPAGIFMILALIAVWAVIVASVADLLDGMPDVVHIIYYLVAGIIWILPLKPLLLWSETGRWRLPKE
ncbi:DUF2842 domain-containing protein [Allosphingosinicella vermicomposti]|uniref:DUF2842 domain-containing protein n=1 Tax=Allosphingosinicella vermicomposti TaxID=614671 RepID=UPI000D0F1D12|nr:DUF2842 domain-containing protein [Allosphingosinicella vermicomposti]